MVDGSTVSMCKEEQNLAAHVGGDGFCGELYLVLLSYNYLQNKVLKERITSGEFRSA